MSVGSAAYAPRGTTPRGATPRGASGRLTPRGASGRPPLSARGLERSYGLAPAPGTERVSSTGAGLPRPDVPSEAPQPEVPAAPQRPSLQHGGCATEASTAAEAFLSGDWRQNQEVMKKQCARDRVAFLFNRAPVTSDASAALMELERSQPAQIPLSTNREFHCLENHGTMGPRELVHEKRRDRMTEYAEARLKQANVGFRK
mmetsp:Transcript_53905/g.121381  ORF Transcript_53905/g.121381 Transcript_53905/m.121381 type:complete len:202 (-) Transcript_53905:79-684(-)